MRALQHHHYHHQHIIIIITWLQHGRLASGDVHWMHGKCAIVAIPATYLPIKQQWGASKAIWLCLLFAGYSAHMAFLVMYNGGDFPAEANHVRN